VLLDCNGLIHQALAVYLASLDARYLFKLKTSISKPQNLSPSLHQLALSTSVRSPDPWQSPLHQTVRIQGRAQVGSS
jgi:hypothetical protein